MDKIGPNRVLKWYHKEWRQHFGLSQETVANRMSTTKGQISKLENPDSRTGQRMNDDWVLRYSEAFDLSPRDLMRHPDAPDLNEILRGASPEEQQRITTAVKLLRTG